MKASINTTSGTGLLVTPEAASLIGQQAAGRALVIEFRELGPAGCCSAGAMVKLNWRKLLSVRSDPDLVNGGDVDGVPLFYHHVLNKFLHEHRIEVVRRSFGPIRWLAIKSEKDPAMWCLFGDGPFEKG